MKTEKFEIKHRYTGDVIFSHECEDNSIKKTVEAAVEQGISLADADLPDENLYKAALFRAALKDKELCGAYKGRSDLAHLFETKFPKRQKDDMLEALGISFVKKGGEK